MCFGVSCFCVLVQYLIWSNIFLLVFVFFFSRRRRHTSCALVTWSSDVCSSDLPDKFGAFLEGVRKHCPEMIVQFSTGGRGRGAEQRGSMLHLKPDMASLATGSVNFPSMIYENPPELIDSLAASMIKYEIARAPCRTSVCQSV